MPSQQVDLSIVVIGRNEGERLRACLESVIAADRQDLRTELIYVDSASSDDSVSLASDLGAKVIALRPSRPSAALARNAGWRRATGRLVLFLDGDTRLHPQFIGKALEAINHADTAVIWGHRRERRPEQSVYVRVLDLDWIYPAGESDFCGGDALMRRDALEAVGGFDETLIAGEEPELCRRLRALGYRILHIDTPMTDHDLAVNSFRAYWRRAYRAGHAYAEVAARFRRSDDPLWHRETRQNLLIGGLLLGLVATAPLWVLTPKAAAIVVVLALLALVRTTQRASYKHPAIAVRLLYALHAYLQHLPILAGQLAWHLNTIRGRRGVLIEYKQIGTAP